MRYRRNNEKVEENRESQYQQRNVTVVPDKYTNTVGIKGLRDKRLKGDDIVMDENHLGVRRPRDFRMSQF